MGTRLRLALLMLTATTVHQGAPHQVPGARSGVVPVRTLPCPKDSCGGQGEWQSGYLYSCDECNDPFYYCTACRRQLGADEDHGHDDASG